MVFTSCLNESLSKPAAKLAAKLIWYRISRNAVSAALEGIDRVSRRRGVDVGFKTVAVHDIDRAVEQAGDVLLETRIVVHGKMRFGVDLNQYIDIALGAVIAACNRAKYRRPAHTARAQILLGPAQGFKGGARGVVHA